MHLHEIGEFDVEAAFLALRPAEKTKTKQEEKNSVWTYRLLLAATLARAGFTYVYYLTAAALTRPHHSSKP